jgi:hypothetical protein
LHAIDRDVLELQGNSSASVMDGAMAAAKTLIPNCRAGSARCKYR